MCGLLICGTTTWIHAIWPSISRASVEALTSARFPQTSSHRTCHLAAVQVCERRPTAIPRVDGSIDLYPKEPGGCAVPDLQCQVTSKLIENLTLILSNSIHMDRRCPAR